MWALFNEDFDLKPGLSPWQEDQHVRKTQMFTMGIKETLCEHSCWLSSLVSLSNEFFLSYV